MQEEEENEVDRDAVGQEQQLLGKYELNGGLNDGLGNGFGNSVRQQKKQSVLPLPSPPVTSIIWERFLPVKSLKVLLVENDDSTRQVVTALLRNCSYEVIAVSNGWEAWKTLLELSFQVDIVLTEVVMPSLSGIGLLDKIMSHKSLKNIPVIMMSSHDSMGIVFKCLSKGAVDFLAKPIRKNELKNLWQHVWRRCHSSSGSGSESGIQTQKSVKSKSVDSDENSRRSDDDDVSMEHNDKDDSDNGSGTQSSWTKHAPESPRATFPGDQPVEAPDSTCAQFIHQKPDPISNDYCHSCSACSQPKNQHDEKNRENDSEGKVHNSESTVKTLEDSNPVEKSTTILGTMSVQASNSLHRFVEEKDKVINEDSRSFELSLKRLRSVGGDRIGISDDRCVLLRSDLSAFSRYNTSTASTQRATTQGLNSSVLQPLVLQNELQGKVENETVCPIIEQLPNGVDHGPSGQNQTVKNTATSTPPCGSSNMVNGPIEANLGNYSVNVSISGSHHGSNAPNGSTMNPERTNIESENGLTGKVEAVGCNGSGSGSGSGSGVDESRFAQRVAALTKFRQKRKQRCFQKKVRYQSRKKLAEQRPRVRGQFVKQMSRDHTDLDTDD